MALAGCAAEGLLDEIPRDFGLRQEVSGELAENNEVRVVSLEDMPETQKTECFLMEEAFLYAYDNLSAPEQLWYRDVEGVLGSFGETAELDASSISAFDVSKLDEIVDKIFRCVLSDHPELFYVDGYSCTKYMRGEEVVSLEFSGNYTMEPEAARGYREEIEEAAEAIVLGIGENASDYDKVKYVYDTIIYNTDYDLNAPDNQNVYSVFVNHRSVCQGYAKATQYLLNLLGVESTLVLGTVDTGEGHVWNLVKIDGEYYYVDTTWGDVSYQVEESGEGQDKDAGGEPAPEDGGSEGSRSMPEINYDYLNVTTEELLRTHSIGGPVPMPQCTANAANYYVVEGAYFTCYDREQMGELFDRGSENPEAGVNVKCADEECYQEILDALVENQEIFNYLEDESGVAYARNEKQLSLTFWVTNE